MNTIENINTIVNEDTVDTVVQAVEAIPVKTINWSKLGKAGLVVGAVAGIVAGVSYIARKKKAKSNEEDTDAGIDNVKVAEADFVE